MFLAFRTMVKARSETSWPLLAFRDSSRILKPYPAFVDENLKVSPLWKALNTSYNNSIRPVSHHTILREKPVPTESSTVIPEITLPPRSLFEEISHQSDASQGKHTRSHHKLPRIDHPVTHTGSTPESQDTSCKGEHDKTVQR